MLCVRHYQFPPEADEHKQKWESEIAYQQVVTLKGEVKDPGTGWL